MYPRAELRRLAAHKAALQRDIALQRARCVSAAARVVQPLAWLDRLLAVIRRLAPLALAAVGVLGVLRARTLVPRWGLLARMLRWSPVVFGAIRRVRGVLSRRAAGRAGGRAGARPSVS